jgi:uncharacterized protein (DUF1330 family)
LISGRSTRLAAPGASPDNPAHAARLRRCVASEGEKLMSAYVVVHGTVKDQGKMQEYAAAAGPTLAPFGGELVCRGASETLAGEHPHSIMVILRFPDRKAVHAWYASPAYQAAIPTRLAAMDSVFIAGGE